MKNKIYFLIGFAFLAMNANVLIASSFLGQKNITITTEVFEDLYLAGQNVLIDAPVRGDLVCAAGDVIIQDSISEDVIMAGGTLKVLGVIGDDLRVAGGTVTIMHNINGDLIIAGGEVTVGENVVIGGNLRLVGGKLTMNGTVLGVANLRGGDINWNGRAEKDLTIKSTNLVFNGIVLGEAHLAAKNISLGTNAEFHDNVQYWNEAGNYVFDKALFSGAGAAYNADLGISQLDFTSRHLGVGLFLFWVYRLLTAALIIGLLIWMFHKFFFRNSLETSQNHVNHLGYGVLYVIGLPLLIILAFITVIGIPIGFMLTIAYGLTIALGHILASLLIAYGINKYYNKNWNRRTLFFAALSSYLALKLIGIIPLLGFLVSLIVVITAFGTLLSIWREIRLKRAYQ